MSISALLLFVAERFRADTMRDNYLFDCLWLLATDNRARKLPRYWDYVKKPGSGGDGLSGDDVMQYLFSRLGGDGH